MMFINRARRIADGVYTTWMANSFEPSMASHPDTPNPGDYDDFILVAAALLGSTVGGGGGGGGGRLKAELTPQIDGLIDNFVVPAYQPGSGILIRNGSEELIFVEVDSTHIETATVPAVTEWLRFYYVPL